MHGLALLRLGHQDLEALGGQALFEEVLLHGEGGAQQADGGQLQVQCGLAGRVGDVQEGQADGRLYVLGHAVHGVGAEHDALGAAGLEALRGVHQDLRRVVPAPGVLGLFDRPKVDAVHQQLRRTQRPQAVAHLLVDQSIVFGAGFPAHAANQANSAHGVWLLLLTVCGGAEGGSSRRVPWP